MPTPLSLTASSRFRLVLLIGGAAVLLIGGAAVLLFGGAPAPPAPTGAERVDAGGALRNG
jgi:hypothetical protein